MTNDSTRGSSDPFPTTRWSVILHARADRSSHAREALDTLYRAYWFPLYGYVRRRGYCAEDAGDMLQSYFAYLIEKNLAGVVEPEKGCFRSFLLHTLKNFMSSEYERSRAEKRGGSARSFSLDVEGAERLWASKLTSSSNPEHEYERHWAETVVDRALADLEREAEARGKAVQFQRLKGVLTGETPDASYRELARELDMSVSAAKVAVHRLRKRLGRTVRREVAHTIDDPDQVDSEVRYLFDILAS